MTSIWTKDDLLEGDFGVGSWPRHPRGVDGRRDSIKVGNCCKLHWVLRLWNPRELYGSRSQSLGSGATAGIHTCRVTLRVGRVARGDSCSHP